ncbi:HD domain-containing protein [Clostridium thermobutyricum]|uniref:HD domain-containing protein n=1 Tax=Clostridium thermobutyricum TaxID=29372 RepID=UPI0018ABE4FC|nr:HD domain-containing protein [Clostridium thermobutyricum]
MYNKMFNFVKTYLVDNDAEKFNFGSNFRNRSEHISRVFMWSKRLLDDRYTINVEALLTAAIFHDIGYAVNSNNLSPDENSAILCEKYLTEEGFDFEFINLVTYLIKNHSNKELLTNEEVPIELILLIEANLLDETGALSIISDSMFEGSLDEQSYYKTYHQIITYSYNNLKTNPMVTQKAKMFWKEKQKLTKLFIEQLAFDIGLLE